MVIGATIGVVLVVVIFFAGLASRANGGTSNQGNDNLADGCAAACANLRAKRMQTCGQRARVAAHQAVVSDIARHHREAATAAGLLLVAAIALSVIPIIGEALAYPMWGAYAAAQAYELFLLGQLTGASLVLATLRNGVATAQQLEEDAAARVRNLCSAAEANECIASLAACSE